jgi:hypothetical protein
MADANALQGEFAPERGWAKRAVDRLLSDIFNRCFSPRGIGCELPHALVGAACTVDMDVYRRVCEQHPHFTEKAPEQPLALRFVHAIGMAYDATQSFGESIHGANRIIGWHVDGVLG